MFQATLKKPSICFIYAPIYHVLLNNTNVIVGGAEIQQKILAEGLANQGFNISFVTERVHDQKTVRVNPTLTIFPALEIERGNKYLRKLLYLPFSLWKILKHVNADIYYHRNPSYLSGLIFLFCKLNNKRFVLAGATDSNFSRNSERNLSNILDKISARSAIKFAEKIIVQNTNQKHLLLKNYKKTATVFPNIFPTAKLRTDPSYVLWVSRIESLKRPTLFLELAKECPQYKFIMVGGKGPDFSLVEGLKERASLLPNVTYLGHQPFETVEHLFDNASAFLNTSIPGTEGFPNTFLQAWSRGIPVISPYDVDDFISRYKLGIIAKTVSQMKSGLRSLLRNPDELIEDSKKIQTFFKNKFSTDTLIPYFVEILTK